MSVFHLPDLGEGLQDAEIVAWHVAVGDRVVPDQPLVSVETDKAVVEIPSPQEGRIARLFGAPGDIVEIGAPLITFEASGQADVGTVVGSIAEEDKQPETVEAPKSGALRSHAAVKAAPAVRALARKLGVDLEHVGASGPDDTILARDVERAAATLAAAGPLQPLRGVRRAMAINMERAHAAVVPASVTDEADIHAWSAETDPTLRLVRALVAACRAEPALNAWYLGREQGRRLHTQVDLGIAMDTADGLFVPVLRNAGDREAQDLREGLERMKADVKARRVPAEELRGQTITLSNFGMFGGRHAALVVLPPQVAILGAGRIGECAVAVEGQVVAHPVLPLSLTFDHRAVMGGEASRFLAAVVADLEEAA
ncbi:MAG: dihydrolipoamide acetyltransferase family protein [Kiloniellales bacterium]